MASSSPSHDQLSAQATPEKSSPDLLAPLGWQKKIASPKKGGTPTRKDVSFIAPDGEEIKSKRMLERYLKSHPGGPAVSEFDWSAGETPTRRSSRLSSKVRPAVDTPEGGSSGKRSRKKVTEEEAPAEEEKPEAEESPAEVPPSAAKEDEVMEDVEKITEDVKTAEETKVLAVEENADGKEGEPVEEQTQKETEVTPEVVQAGKPEVDEVKKPEAVQIPIEEKVITEQCEVTQAGSKTSEDKDVGTNQQNAHDGKLSFPEEHKEQKEVSDKMSSGFQQFSETQNSSRPVGVSI